jgi:hypothetical protein
MEMTQSTTLLLCLAPHGGGKILTYEVSKVSIKYQKNINQPMLEDLLLAKF